VLDQRVRDLTRADEVRACWYVHTAETRAVADRARAELADRGVDPDRPADAVPVADWLAAHEADTRAEDAGRAIIGEADLADEHRSRVEAERKLQPVPGVVAETAVPDIRDVTADESPAPTCHDEGRGRVATADATAAAVERAQRALLELRARRAVERRRVADEADRIDQAQRDRDQPAAARAVVAGVERVEE
jgi:hypothetical protein